MAAVQGTFQRVLNWAPSLLRTPHSIGTSETQPMRENTFVRLVGPFESYVVSLQSLLIWERPYLSAVALIAVNCLFWIIVSCSRRFYSFLAVVTALGFMYRTWVNSIWPEIRVPIPEGEDTEQWTPVNPQVLSVPELSRYFNDWSIGLKKWGNSLLELRRNHPGLFCTLMCTVFGLLAFLGRMVSGVLIVYTLLMAVTLGPGIALYVIPETWYDHVEGVLCMLSGISRRSPKRDGEERTSTRRVNSDSDLEEFLPKEDKSLLTQLSLSLDSETRPEVEGAESPEVMPLAEELGMGHLVKSEEESLLYQGLENFPDPDEESDKESLLPVAEMPSLRDSASPMDDSGIHFVASHFEDDESDSENEDAFIRGLNFSHPPHDPSVSRPLALSTSFNPSEEDTHSHRDQGSSSHHQQLLSHSTGSRSLRSSRHPSQGSDIDINEYEIVHESDFAS